MDPLVAVVVGTRPEVIKMAPLLRVLRGSPGLRTVLIGTAQHRQMMDQMLRVFGLELDFDLDLMRSRQTPDHVLAEVSRLLPPLLRRLRPSWLLVQGDTTSALAAALCAFHQGIPIAHVESGLRSHDLSRPFPEELNRVLIDRIARLHFAPTALNRRNLLAEGVPARGIHVVGNTVVDSLAWALKRPPPRKTPAALTRFLAPGGRRAVLTVHRRESLGEPLDRVFRSARGLTRAFPDLLVLYPVHPNPAVALRARKAFGGEPRVLLCPPLDYPDFLRALARADLALSDSGGVQEEAPVLGVPVLVLREVTDRPEIIAKGQARLVGMDPGRIVAAASRLLAAPGKRRRAGRRAGDGPSRRAASLLLRSLKAGST